MARHERYWSELRSHPPREICQKALVSHRKPGYYSVPLLAEEHQISPARESVARVTVAGREDSDCELLLLMYLLKAADTPIVGQWVTEKGLPGGELFFRGPHTLPSQRFIECFGGDPQELVQAAQRHGGSSTDCGDAAVELQVLPRIPMMCVLWSADQEFGARARFLFDASVAAHLPLDMILSMTHRVADRLTGFGAEAAPPAEPSSPA